METVKELLDTKGHNIYSIAPDSTVYDAIKIMSDKAIGALVVTDSGNLVGVISERDYARKVILEGRSSKETKVKDIMTTKVVSVALSAHLGECMQLMTEHKFRHLPVVSGGEVAGMLSIGDIVKAIITEQKFTIEQLEHYITSNY